MYEEYPKLEKYIYFYAVNAGAIAVMMPLINACPSGLNCLWVTEENVRQKHNSKKTNTIDLDDFH